MRSILKQFIPPSTLGMLDYWCRPQWRASWGGAFNGQAGRIRLFDELLETWQPDYIVETGTFRGTTTRHISQRFTGPIYTVEHNPRAAGFARAALRGQSNINLVRGSSVEFLEQTLPRYVSATQRGLFYLDAHWHGSVPILDELRLIASGCEDPLVMIDDFQVPDDTDYGFDDYGEQGALTLAYLHETLESNHYSVFYPSLRGADETGMCRGCVVLGRSRQTVETLGLVSALRPAGSVDNYATR